MSETELGREPVEIIEIITPKCSNVYGVSPCTASGSGDIKCFNTRATCQDASNYQARPLTHLTPNLTAIQGDTIASGDIDRTADVLFEATVTFPAIPTGTIWEQGGTTDGAYLGITGSNLVWRAGDGGATPAADIGYISAPVSGFAGRTVTLIAGVELSTGTVYLWEFDPIELVLTKIGEDSFTAGATWADTDAGAIGENGGSEIPTGETGGTFNGIITSVRFFEGETSAQINEDADAYRQRYFFTDGRKAKASDDIYTMPALLGVDTVGTRVNVSGADGRYEPLGRRAYMSISIADFAHTDFPFDPYLSGRTYDPLDRGTFWPKWLARNKYGKTRAIVRRYTGYDGQALSAMRSQSYVLSSANVGREQVSLECRDILSLTEFLKTQVPAQSSGQLSADLTDVATTLTVTGDVTSEYPASGTVRIDDELIQYTGRALSGADTEFTGLTRGTDGSTADEHDINGLVQICRRYEDARIDTVLEEILITDAGIPAQLIDLAKFKSEYDDHLSAYDLTTIISEPTGADRLIGEMAEQCAFYIWWDERAQLIDMQAIRPVVDVSKTLTQENDIIGDTFTVIERPDERVTTVAMYYKPRDFSGSLEKPANFRSVAVRSDSSAQGLDQYGVLPQTREMFSRWLTTDAQVAQTIGRFGSRYVDVPFYVSFMVDAKDRELWVGDFITISHSYLLTVNGERDTLRRWLIVEAEEVEAGTMQRLTCVDVTLDGRLYFITRNDIGNYNAAEFELGNAFITDNSGLNPDNTTGANIS